MIAAIVVRLPFLRRPVALPVGFALVCKDTDAASRLSLGRELVEALAAAAPGRIVHVVADSAYAGVRVPANGEAGPDESEGQL